MTETASAPVENPTVQQEYEDYWGSDETIKHFLPDGKQYFVIQPMNEGKKAQFQRMTNRDVVMEQKTQDVRFKVDPASERHELIKASVIDWYLVQKTPGTNEWTPAPFSGRSLGSWLEKAPPHIVEELEHKIRLSNPWLQADMNLEEIDKEIDRLRDLRAQKEREEQGESGSANK